MKFDWSIIVIAKPLPLGTVQDVATRGYGEMVKAVVDLKQNTVALGGEMHTHIAALMQHDGSAASDLWGVRLYPGRPQPEWIEFTSQINLRPDNPTMEITDKKVRAQVSSLLARLITR